MTEAFLCAVIKFENKKRRDIISVPHTPCTLWTNLNAI